MRGDEKTVGLLVSAGAAVNTLGECGTPLQVAAAGRHGGVVGLLLKAGADANAQNPFHFSAAGRKVRLSHGSY